LRPALSVAQCTPSVWLKWPDVLQDLLEHEAEIRFIAILSRERERTRSQAVARIADRTASQHLWGSRDVIGHVTIW